MSDGMEEVVGSYVSKPSCSGAGLSRWLSKQSTEKKQIDLDAMDCFDAHPKRKTNAP